MSKPWPTLRLGEVLRQRKPDISVEPTQPYQFAGVYCFGRGVFRGQERRGSEFAYRSLTRLREGEFVYPKLMAWEGAFGVVPASCDGCYVSPEFPVFEIDRERLAPRFLDFYFRIPRVWEYVSGGSTGTNVRRRRLHPSDFLTREISLPPLAKQRRLVARIEKLAAQINEARTLRQQGQTEIANMLRAAFHRIADGAPRMRMAEVAPIVRRPVEVDALREYPELGIRSYGKGTFHKPALTGLEVASKRIYRIEPGDLLFSNVFAWEGAMAVAKP
jgi:type I restriction enzyme S subunit